LLWIGAILCFFAYSIQAASYEDVPGDNVRVRPSVRLSVSGKEVLYFMLEGA